MPGLALFVALASVAIAGHLAQVAHFLLVPHVVGADGRLRHATPQHLGCTRHGAEAPAGDDGEPGPAGPGEGERCPLFPPGLETAPPAEAPRPATAAALPAGPAPMALPAPRGRDVLALAPKHSPPDRPRS